MAETLYIRLYKAKNRLNVATVNTPNYEGDARIISCCGCRKGNIMHGEVDIGRVYRSLKHSTVRGRVYIHVCKAVTELSTGEISDALHCPEKNVIGALIGDGKRYKKEESLVELGVIKCHESTIHGHIFLLAFPTDNGLEIFNSNKLKDYANTTKNANTKKSPNAEGALIDEAEEGMMCKE